MQKKLGTKLSGKHQEKETFPDLTPILNRQSESQRRNDCISMTSFVIFILLNFKNAFFCMCRIYMIGS